MERNSRRETKISAATATSSESVKNGNCSKRKPLLDLTNFNLIPTETLRKLCSNQLSPSRARSLLHKSQTLGHPNGQKTFHSKSDTSIGSSNFINIKNPNAHNLTAVPDKLPPSSFTNPGDDCSKLVAYNLRRPVENLEGETKIDTRCVSSTPTCNEKTKDEGRLVSAPLSTTPAKKVKLHQKAIAASFNLIPNEKAAAKEKAIAEPLSSIPLEKLKHRVNATAIPLSSTPIEKLNEKGKENALPFSSTTVGKTKNKGKAVAMPFSHLNEETKINGKSATMLINCPLTSKRREKNNVDNAVSSCPPRWRTRSIRDELNQTGDVKPSKAWTDPRPKKKKKRCSPQENLPPEFVKQQKAYYEEVDAFELPVEEASYSDLD